MFIVPQKIDRIKSQLTALVDLATIQDEDLRNGEDRLQESELETLRAAGVLAPKKTDGHEHVPHHIVFVEDDAEGAADAFTLPSSADCCSSPALSRTSAAQQLRRDFGRCHRAISAS